MKDHLAKEMDNLETKLEIQLAQWQPAQLKNVGSIKGIGKRATGRCVCCTRRAGRDCTGNTEGDGEGEKASVEFHDYPLDVVKTIEDFALKPRSGGWCVHT